MKIKMVVIGRKWLVEWNHGVKWLQNSPLVNDTTVASAINIKKESWSQLASALQGGGYWVVVGSTVKRAQVPISHLFLVRPWYDSPMVQFHPHLIPCINSIFICILQVVQVITLDHYSLNKISFCYGDSHISLFCVIVNGAIQEQHVAFEWLLFKIAQNLNRGIL